jgi:hypothetical protein
MTLLNQIKAELEDLKNLFAKMTAPKEPEAKVEGEGSEPEAKVEVAPEVTAALDSLKDLEAKVSGIDLEAIKAEAKAELEASVKADLEKEFEARVASAAAEKLASAGAAPLATGAATKEDKQTLAAKGLKGRALTVAAMKIERGETL